VAMVVQLGAHKAPKSKITEVWEKLNKNLFDAEEFREYKNDHYKEDNFRKIRDRFNTIVDNTQSDIERGNQSGKF
jgi:hypothetical protein